MKGVTLEFYIVIGILEKLPIQKLFLKIMISK